jgi:superfamily II DNA/RNA helicase
MSGARSTSTLFLEVSWSRPEAGHPRHDERKRLNFNEFGLSDALVAVLTRQGITEPFPIQSQTIHTTLAGRDVCGKAKTGSGKTLAFGLPLLERVEPGARPGHPRALVLAPTRELARQIRDVLKPLGRAVDLRVEAFYGGAPMEKQLTALRRPVDVAVATPGRLIDFLQRDAFHLDDIQTVVIDEADEMANMGFLPQVEWIMRRLAGNTPQVLLFSATLDGDVDVLIRRYLRDPVRHEVDDDENDGDLRSHRFFEVHQMDRIRVAAAIARGTERTMLFTRTKRGADRAAYQLREEGVAAAPIHGDLRQSAREKTLQRFSSGQLNVLVATNVAARGLHVDDVDVVIHFDLPDDHKTYLHRSGRTARAGRTGAVATFVAWNQLEDAARLKRHLGIDEPTIQVFSNDDRLADLAAFVATAEESTKATGTEGARVTPVRGVGGARGRSSGARRLGASRRRR